MDRKCPKLRINLSEQQKKEIIEEIVSFYLEVRGETMGIIEQQQIMELFLDNLAPVIYNKALDDAHIWYEQQQNNMESDFYSLYKNIR